MEKAAKGLSLNIGLNAVDPAHYAGWSGELTACEADALDMAGIARSRGFKATTLLTSEAKRADVVSAFSDAAATLQAEDIFVLSYSGHGGQLPDYNSDEDDGQDETWCLYDSELVDDELYALLAQFRPGVRIEVYSDSCHSGTVVKLAHYRSSGRMPHLRESAGSTRFRFMPPEVAQRTYRQNAEFYDPILRDPARKESRAKVKASVLLLSGCQDNQLSADGTFNGLFTANLLQVWNGGKFKRSHRSFWKAIMRRMPPDQTPNYFSVGAADPAFEKQPPFKL